MKFKDKWGGALSTVGTTGRTKDSISEIITTRIGLAAFLCIRLAPGMRGRLDSELDAAARSQQEPPRRRARFAYWSRLEAS